ncbi:MAG: competence protein ComK [Bacilli bacterium]|nr:competence protein ComK [Bacilli bacterium]
MENYIINNKTIAILKNNNKTIIYDVDNIRVINKNIKRILDENCSFYGSSLSGRKKSAKNILNIHYKVPVVVKEDVILLQVNNIRNKECLFLVLNKIVDYKLENQKLKIICINKQVFLINISKNSFEKMLINSIKLNNILKWQKCENFV